MGKASRSSSSISALQIQRIFAQFQHVITFRQRLGIRTLLHHSITAFAVDRQGDQLKTTLANHFDLGVDKAVDYHRFTFISFKNEFGLHRTDSVGKRVAESLQIGQQHFTLKGGATISQFARVNVRWNRVIQHRRSIIGMHPAMSKEIQPCASAGRPARILRPALRRRACCLYYSHPARFIVGNC